MQMALQKEFLVQWRNFHGPFQSAIMPIAILIVDPFSVDQGCTGCFKKPLQRYKWYQDSVTYPNIVFFIVSNKWVLNLKYVLQKSLFSKLNTPTYHTNLLSNIQMFILSNIQTFVSPKPNLNKHL